MSKGVCEYCGKPLGENRKTICQSCCSRRSDMRWFMRKLEPYRVALEKKKARAMFDDTIHHN